MPLYKHLLIALISLCTAPLFAEPHTKFPYPTRVWLTHTYLPSLSGHILYVGVGAYTTTYHLLTKTPTLFETIDLDPEKAPFGSPYGHHTMDFLDFHPPYRYDHICLYGMLGFPPVTPTSYYSITNDLTIKKAIAHAHSLLAVGGTLQLGPSYDLVEGQSAPFWIKTFTQLLSETYELKFLGVGPDKDNVVWWGTKIKE